jgi:hypothetical protein
MIRVEGASPPSRLRRRSARCLGSESDGPGQPIIVSMNASQMARLRVRSSLVSLSLRQLSASFHITRMRSRLTASSKELRMCGSGPPSIQSMNDETSEKNGSSSWIRSAYRQPARCLTGHTDSVDVALLVIVSRAADVERGCLVGVDQPEQMISASHYSSRIGLTSCGSRPPRPQVHMRRRGPGAPPRG